MTNKKGNGKQTTRNAVSVGKQKKKVRLRHPSEWGIPEEVRTDRDYWDMPLIERAYMRLLYAGFTFLVVGCLLDMLGIPFVGQCFLAGLVALTVLLFRMAYPNGFSMIGEDIMNNIQEGYKQQSEILAQQAKQQQKQGKRKK